jgi:hypothetical protein
MHTSIQLLDFLIELLPRQCAALRYIGESALPMPIQDDNKECPSINTVEHYLGWLTVCHRGRNSLSSMQLKKNVHSHCFR